jgi:hypothetical protein
MIRKQLLMRLVISLLVQALVLSAAAQCAAGGAGDDVVWSGIVEVRKDVFIPPGVTLIIHAGTEIRFGRGVGIYIEGAVQAVGSPAERIVFTSAEKNPDASDWDEINLQGAAASSFVNCDFQYAFWAVHSHDTNLTIKACRFINNDGGIRFRGGPVTFSGSIFTGNHIAIRSFRGEGEIRENLFIANEIAIFVRDKGDRIRIYRNGFEKNERYAIRLGDFNREDVDARENWWGGTPPDQAIFDSHEESYIGTVRYEPVLKEPIVVDIRRR